MKKIIVGLLVATLLLPNFSYAQVADAPQMTLDELKAQLITILLQQVEVLRAQIAELKASQEETRKETKRIADKVDTRKEESTGGEEETDEELEVEASFSGNPQSKGENGEGYNIYVFRNVKIQIQGADDGEKIYYPNTNGFNTSSGEVVRTMDCGGGKGTDGFDEGNGKGCKVDGNSSASIEVEVWTKEKSVPVLKSFYYYVNSPSGDRESVSVR